MLPPFPTQTLTNPNRSSRPPLSLAFPFGTQDGVDIAPSTLTTLDNDAGMGLFGLHPKRSHYAKNAKYHQLFARKEDYICSYHGPIRTPAECITHPSMYIFTDPSDPLGHYIDSWTPEAESRAMGAMSTNTSRITRSTAPSNGLHTNQQRESMPKRRGKLKH